jgi:hypothetical protein
MPSNANKALQFSTPDSNLRPRDKEQSSLPLSYHCYPSIILTSRWIDYINYLTSDTFFAAMSPVVNGIKLFSSSIMLWSNKLVRLSLATFDICM